VLFVVRSCGTRIIRVRSAFSLVSLPPYHEISTFRERQRVSLSLPSRSLLVRRCAVFIFPSLFYSRFSRLPLSRHPSLPPFSLRRSTRARSLPIRSHAHARRPEATLVVRVTNPRFFHFFFPKRKYPLFRAKRARVPGWLGERRERKERENAVKRVDRHVHTEQG